MSQTTTFTSAARLLLVMALVWMLASPGVASAQGFSSFSGSVPAPSAPLAASPNVAGGGSPTSRPASFEQADKVVVRKGERRLYLLREERVIAQYPVRLGLNPFGPKTREGDFRTPEGRYRLVKRNQKSDFFLSIQLSYPSAEDAAVAKENGVEPGGQIMIHGQPNVPRKGPEFYATRDWTDGCIALSNSDMVDVWLRTGVGIPIEIRP
jgi:murein L,D-transpeptidase YafK